MSNLLIEKYNVQGPRYTSYPTVPYWENEPTHDQWRSMIRESFNKYNSKEGISLYIHLPYCQSLCTYCGCNVRITVNHAVELTYIKAVLKEWDLYLLEFEGIPIIKEIHIGGGTPTFFSPENLTLLINGILSKAIAHPEPEFGIEGHPNSTTEEHLQQLYNLGFRRLSLGIQDFDPKVQQIANRIQTFETVERVTSQARAIGYTSINYDLIYGLPFQSKQTISDTFTKVNLLKPDRIAFYSYAHVPWIKPSQRSFTEKDLPTNAEKRALYEKGRTLLEAAGYFEIGMDHFALNTDSLFTAAQQKTLHRNFMGYTSGFTHLLIGLGCSSISDTWAGFAQNCKTVEGYLADIANNTLPIFRGHILSEEDIILRQHILNIMCKLETNWLEQSMQTDALFQGIDRMEELQKDGLVIIENQHLYVTSAGKPFLRNICMAIDARLWKEKPTTQVFSETV